uniref:Uncharacterized protein n=1 Tax=Pararge aegeria TaxID=116150 RepID=S4PBP7_9NEOP
MQKKANLYWINKKTTFKTRVAQCQQRACTKQPLTRCQCVHNLLTYKRIHNAVGTHRVCEQSIHRYEWLFSISFHESNHLYCFKYTYSMTEALCTYRSRGPGITHAFCLS